MQDFNHWLLEHLPIYRWLHRKLHHISFPGFQKIPIAVVFTHLFRSLEKEDLGSRASSMAFNFFLALFPAVIFFFTFIAFIPIEDLHTSIMSKISELMPHTAYQSVESTIEDILKNQHGGLLSFGFFSALIFSSNAMFNMFKAFNTYDKTVESRSVLYRRLLSLALTVFLAALIIFSVLLVTFGQAGIDYLDKQKWISDGLTYYGLIILKWGVTLLIFYTVIACLYFFASLKKRRFQFISAGTTIATFGSLLTTVGFAAYVNNFDSYNKLYGSIGTLLVVLLMIYFNSLMILFGYELNSSIEAAVRTKKQPVNISADDLEQPK